MVLRSPAQSCPLARFTSSAERQIWVGKRAACDYVWEARRMRLVRSHPVLAVHDLDRSAAWYEAVFGCTANDVVPGHWVFCRSGEVHFMLAAVP